MSLFPNYLPFKQDMNLHLNKLESPQPSCALCQVLLKISLVVLVMKIKYGPNKLTRNKFRIPPPFPPFSCTLSLIYQCSLIESPLFIRAKITTRKLCIMYSRGTLFTFNSRALLALPHKIHESNEVHVFSFSWSMYFSKSIYICERRKM